MIWFCCIFVSFQLHTLTMGRMPMACAQLCRREQLWCTSWIKRGKHFSVYSMCQRATFIIRNDVQTRSPGSSYFHSGDPFILWKVLSGYMGWNSFTFWDIDHVHYDLSSLSRKESEIPTNWSGWCPDSQFPHTCDNLI